MEERYLALRGGVRPWWDVAERRLVKTAILYLAQGCPDWGERGGKRNELCTFCSLPLAAAGYREEFYGGRMSPEDHLHLFEANLRSLGPGEDFHTLMVFNAGSFLADIANPPAIREQMVRLVAIHPTIHHLVIESRAELVTDKALAAICDILSSVGKRLTIRIGVETQDDHLRLKVLRKGHSRRALYQAAETAKKYGAALGGYVLLNPAPGLDPMWAMEETVETIRWILGGGVNDLGMDEAYFCSTNVGPGTALTRAWEAGEFEPASLWMVLRVLRRAASEYGGRVHLLPFKDEPSLLSVPSNHVAGGIPQSLEGAEGCDLAFHEMFGKYRETMDASLLVPPVCECKPDWF